MKSNRSNFGSLAIISGFIALAGFIQAQVATEPVQGGTTPLAAANVDWSSASDLEVMLQAVEATTPAPAESVPRGGTFYSAQFPNWPPLPGNIRNVPVWNLGDGSYLVDDLDVNYSQQPLNSSMMAGRMSALDAPLPGDGGSDDGTNSYTSNGSSYVLSDYGTNLWIAQAGLLSGNLAGVVSNSSADISYEIQSKENLLQTNWNSEGFILGSELTNWTPMSVAQNGRTNLFLRIRSWASSDGSGLPDWWELEYFGTTGVDPNAPDSAGDGWTIYQKFQMGLNPTNFYTPPAPQGLTVSYNVNNGNVSVNWLPSPGPVTGYTVKKFDYQTEQTTTFTFLTNTTGFPDTVLDTPADLVSDGPTIYVTYQVQAQYGTNNSAWSGAVWLEANAGTTGTPVLNANWIYGPTGTAYLAVSAIPSGTVTLLITRIDNRAEFFYGNASFNTTNSIPVTSLTNGLYLIPASWTPSADIYGYEDYTWWLQSITANGLPSEAIRLGDGYSDSVNHTLLAPPNFDGRTQLKQNLIFLLREPNINSPVTCEAINANYTESPLITAPAGYAYAGYYDVTYPIGSPVNTLDVYRPFADNYLYRNFVFSSTNVDINGDMTTGVTEDGSLELYEMPNNGLPTYQFQPPVTSGTTISALLGTNQTRWLCSYPLSPLISNTSDGINTDLEPIGITYEFDYDNGFTYTMASNARNFFGLPFRSVNIAYQSYDSGGNFTGNLETYTLSPGNSFPVLWANNLYPETVQPQFQTVEYDFWNPNSDLLPGRDGFSTANTSRLMIVPVGSPSQIAGYAKLAVTNGYTGVYGYLQQYFTNAYVIDTNGIVTTNTTGVLSPYGCFFATEPGPVALVTMPDPDTGARGTCTVYCVSLVLDKNHDGNMDLSFNGPDATSPNSPYVLWANQNFDRLTPDADDNTNYEDDVQIASNPGTSTPEPDCNYSNRLANGYSYRAIPTKRDLEDFARLWVCGVTSNLLAALPSGSTITLNWGDVGSPNSGNPTIDLFAAADTDGGIGYLTNETTAAEQTNIFQCPYIGRLGPGQSIQLNTIQFANNWAGNHFIWCGVSNGTGGLNLTIADGSGNVLAQTTAYIQIVDIKQMYERWTVGDNPTNAPTSTPALVTDDLAPSVSGFQYTAPTDANTPYILFVHGWNMEPWEKDRYAETAFKRLYWQGYQGRFGEFRWPTDFDFSGLQQIIMTNRNEKDNFDNSEYQAWRSAPGLLNLLIGLNAEYPGHVYMLAHSLGNVVAGEAIRLAGDNQVVNTYVASQAAVTAHAYDANVPDYSFYYIYGPYTPNIYGNWFAGNNGSGAGSIISFYNTNDYALRFLGWQVDQLTKPDQSVVENGINWNYGYSGSPNDPAPWNNFYKESTNSTVYFNIVTSLNNHYEVMAYAAQSYTTALGTTPGVTNLVSLNLTAIWPSDPTGNNYKEHFWHSAEFRGDSVWEWGYWNTLLFSSQFGFNISNP